MSKEFDYHVKIPVCTPYFKGNEEKYVKKAMKSGWISSVGPHVKEFERLFSMWLYGVNEVNKAVSCTSGTTAIELALHTLKIGGNYGGHFTDEVIMPDFTMIAVPNSVHWAGAKPVLVDCDYDDFRMRDIEQKITKNTKAIIVTHTYGIPENINKIIELCKKYDLKLIEDCAEGLGATFAGSKIGTFGDMSCFSFYANKVITTGEGGMVCSKDIELVKRAFYLKEHTFDENSHFWHKEIGHNYRMTALQAAVGLGQLENIAEHIALKKKVAFIYENILAPIFAKLNQGTKDRNMDLVVDRYYTMPKIEGSVYWMWGIRVPFKTALRQILAREGIETRSYFIPIHQQKPYLTKQNDADYYYSNRLYTDGFYLPSSVGLTEIEIKFICKTLLNAIKEVSK